MRSKVTSVVALIMVALMVPSMVRAQCAPALCIKISDVNGDGFTDSTDLALIIDIVFFGGTSSPALGSTDLNGDGFTDSTDLALVIDVVFFGGSSVFPYREYVLKGRSGAGSRFLLGDDSIQYIIGDDIAGVFAIGEDGPLAELGAGECDKTDTLWICPGTIIEGSPSIANPSAFIVRRSGYVHAVGTPTEPIVFTSTNDPGFRNRGDWGGFVINGCAKNNNAANANVIVAEGDGGVGGGTVNDDNSGCFMYMRVQFAGREFTVDNELNGITLNSVGNGTTLEYVQINQNFDDGIEWFGGTCDCSHTVLSGIGDDSFDSDFGAQWRGQYLIVVQDPTGVNSSNHNGFEWDNEPNAPYTSSPRMKPTIWNATLVGQNCDFVLARHDGAHIRRGADGNINNTVWTKFQSALEYDENTVWDVLDPAGSRIEIEHSIWYDCRTVSGNATTANELPYMPASVGGTHPTNVFPVAGCGNPEILIQVATYDGITPLDFRPIAGDPQGIGINAAGAVPPVDGWFDPTGANFKGALEENDPAPWYAGWTDFSID